MLWLWLITFKLYSSLEYPPYATVREHAGLDEPVIQPGMASLISL